MNLLFIPPSIMKISKHKQKLKWWATFLSPSPVPQTINRPFLLSLNEKIEANPKCHISKGLSIYLSKKLFFYVKSYFLYYHFITPKNCMSNPNSNFLYWFTKKSCIFQIKTFGLRSSKSHTYLVVVSCRPLSSRTFPLLHFVFPDLLTNYFIVNQNTLHCGTNKLLVLSFRTVPQTRISQELIRVKLFIYLHFLFWVYAIFVKKRKKKELSIAK